DAAATSPPEAPTAAGDLEAKLDPISVVLTGMAQLQTVVSELASPKSTVKYEVIKPGVNALPDLPSHGPESSLAFADWLHSSRPALADVSDTSEELWQRTVEEATSWYNGYLRMDPLSRLTAKPEPSAELRQVKWMRVSRRIETMIIAAAPQEIREEVSASRTSGLLPLVCRLFIIYGPGTLMERELGLRNISDPPTGATIQETVDILRKWKRWCARMTELGGVLPDSAIQVRALTKATKTVLSQHPEVAFRINLSRASLQVDMTPDDTKVMKLHAQMLSELESMSHRGDKAKGGDKDSAQAPAKDLQINRHPLSHLVRFIPAGTKAEAKAQPKAPRQPKNTPEGQQQPTAPVGEANATQQQIKSMLADAARFLQQAIPPTGDAPPTASPIAATPVAPPAKAASASAFQGTPVTLASLSAQLESLRAMTGNPEAKMTTFPDKVPVTLAGDAKQEWLRTEGVSGNTCPYLQEQQALQLIAELE
ncbi:GIP, partial [Symbiodinium sp. CCMP2456]